MNRRRYAIAILAGLCIIVAAACVLQSPIFRSVSGLAAEDYVFDSIRIGDSEEHLVGLLKQHQIDYSIENQGDQTLYSHSDSFIGVCFYYVVDGRVVHIAKD